MFDRLFGNREMRVVMLGLDAAGKTTILYKLHIGEILSTVPTIGESCQPQSPPVISCACSLHLLRRVYESTAQILTSLQGQKRYQIISVAYGILDTE